MLMLSLLQEYRKLCQLVARPDCVFYNGCGSSLIKSCPLQMNARSLVDTLTHRRLKLNLYCCVMKPVWFNTFENRYMYSRNFARLKWYFVKISVIGFILQ